MGTCEQVFSEMDSFKPSFDTRSCTEHIKAIRRRDHLRPDSMMSAGLSCADRAVRTHQLGDDEVHREGYDDEGEHEGSRDRVPVDGDGSDE